MYKLKRVINTASWSLVAVVSLLISATFLASTYSYSYVQWVKSGITYKQQVLEWAAWKETSDGKYSAEIKIDCQRKFTEKYPPSKETSGFERALASGPYWDMNVGNIKQWDNQERIDFRRGFERYKGAISERKSCEYSQNQQGINCWGFRYEPVEQPVDSPPIFEDEYKVQRLIALFALPFFIVFCLRSFFSLNHLGWQRITVIAAPVLAMYFVYYYDENERRLGLPEVIVFSIGLLLIFLAIPAQALKLYSWFRESFNRSEVGGEPQTPAKLQTAEPVEPTEKLGLTWKTLKPIAVVFAVAVVAIGFFILRPESMMQTGIAVLVQAVLLVGAVALLRKLRLGLAVYKNNKTKK